MTRLMIGLALLLAGPLAHAVEIRHWERLPLPLPLAVGQERVVFLDRPTRVGLPASLAGVLRVQSAGGALYLKASEPFPATRLQLQLTDSGEVLLLDVSAAPGEQALEPVRIVLTPEAPEAPMPDADTAPPPTPIPVALVRHAAQQLYAPLRTIEPLPGVRPVGLELGGALATLMPLDPVIATPLVAWRLADYRVTAVKLQNRTAGTVLLDPRRLQGRFYAASFQHGDLGPQGTPEDTTVVYLVTRGHDLAAALVPPTQEAEDAR